MRTYEPIFKSQALPFLRDFNPDLVIVSAGYDTLAEDTLAEVSQACPPSLVQRERGGAERGDTTSSCSSHQDPLTITG